MYRRKSFIGHPDATHFRLNFGERVFQQLQAFTPTTACPTCWGGLVSVIDSMTMSAPRPE